MCVRKREREREGGREREKERASKRHSVEKKKLKELYVCGGSTFRLVTRRN